MSKYDCHLQFLEDYHYKKLAVDGVDVDLQILDTGSNDCYSALNMKVGAPLYKSLILKVV